MEKKPGATIVTLPRDLADAVDAIVGEAARDRYVVDLVRERVERDQERTPSMRQREALTGLRGALANVPTPEWDTPEHASQWVHDMRRSDRRSDDH